MFGWFDEGFVGLEDCFWVDIMELFWIDWYSGYYFGFEVEVFVGFSVGVLDVCGNFVWLSWFVMFFDVD